MSRSLTRSCLSVVASLFLITATAAVDARLIRGGGKGSASGPVRTGLASYLLPDAFVAGLPSNGTGGYELPDTFDPATGFAGYASYDFNDAYQGGWPIQAHLDWGQDCAQPFETPASTPANPDFYDCYFELRTDEIFEFSGHAIGLPAPGAYPGNPVLDFTWVLETLAFNTVATWSRGDAGVTEGALLDFDDSVAAGCFAVWQPFQSGYCQRYELNTGLTGAELLALSGGDGLRLSLEVTISADDGFKFYNYTEFGGADPRGDLQPGGSVSGQDSGGLRLEEFSGKMRIEVVPVPATYLLFASGIAGLLWRGRGRRRG